MAEAIGYLLDKQNAVAMKPIMLIASLLFATIASPAQNRNAEKSRLIRKLDTNTTTKFMGISITAASGILFFGSQNYILFSESGINHGSVGRLTGVGMAIGIPMIILGTVLEKQNKQKLKDLSITPVVTQRYGSIQVTYRF